MSKANAKQAVLAALRHHPDLSGLINLPDLSTRAGRDLLEWLDLGGLALVFLRQLQKHDAVSQPSKAWRQALSERQTRNAERMRDMLEEAQQILQTLQTLGVTVACLKGFTLAPDFCDDSSLRHQIDLDFLVAPQSVPVAAEALRSRGYFTSQLNLTHETRFITPLRDIPTRKDDLYRLQQHRQVDLHVSIWEPCEWLPLEVPRDCLDHAEPQKTYGMEYLSLSLEDKFLLQVVHSFRHSFRSWVRLSWLLEIARCMDNHHSDADLWRRVIERAGPSRLMKSIFAFELGLVHRLFHTAIPPALERWTGEALTPCLGSWLDHFAVDWATADWPGSLTNIFLAAEFIPDPDLRRRYWHSRFVPSRRAHNAIDSISAPSPGKFLQLEMARVSFLGHRAVKHLRDVAALPRQQFRWKRALGSAGRPSFDSNC